MAQPGMQLTDGKTCTYYFTKKEHQIKSVFFGMVLMLNGVNQI